MQIIQLRLDEQILSVKRHEPCLKVLYIFSYDRGLAKPETYLFILTVSKNTSALIPILFMYKNIVNMCYD